MIIPAEYKNLTTIAKASGKRLNKWVNGSGGKKAIAEFKLKYPAIEHPLIIKKGKGGGTWGHPELAAIFAAWCNPQFTATVVEQNALLKEKIRTFQVDTPAQIAARIDEVVEVRRMVHQVADKGIKEIELIAKCYFAGAIKQHPQGMTFEQYLPHWLHSMRDRTDMYPSEVLKEMTIKAGKPIAYQGKILKYGCTYAWIDE